MNVSIFSSFLLLHCQHCQLHPSRSYCVIKIKPFLTFKRLTTYMWHLKFNILFQCTVNATTSLLRPKTAKLSGDGITFALQQNSAKGNFFLHRFDFLEPDHHFRLWISHSQPLWIWRRILDKKITNCSISHSTVLPYRVNQPNQPSAQTFLLHMVSIRPIKLH